MTVAESQGIDACSDEVVIELELNGEPKSWRGPATRRLSSVLREDFGALGTKVGCEAGDCGACTILVGGAQVCSCLVAMGQVDGKKVETVEGLADEETLSAIQRSFLAHGAAQCGICTPGMLMAASELLSRTPRPSKKQTEDALGGVLCRCTGYQKIIEAVVGAHKFADVAELIPTPEAGRAVGARMARADGHGKMTGRELFGDDIAPPEATWMRVLRSPHARARFTLGDLDSIPDKTPGLESIITSSDIPGENSFGIYPDLKDQPVLAPGQVRYRGEAVLAIVGQRETLEKMSLEDFPIEWAIEDPVTGIDQALRGPVRVVHDDRSDNVLVEGHVAKGDIEKAFSCAAHSVSGALSTAHVEHAYIEPEAGFARVPEKGARMEVSACTQAPYMDRIEVARVLGLEEAEVRIIPSACGGGFGGKLDVSIQPLLAVAAAVTGKTVRICYTRTESMASSTKRHPAEASARAAIDEHGKLTAFEVSVDFNTGAYASWGPTVADRVPVHASGPYFVPHLLAHSRAIYTNDTPAGAFRGFGVPQVAILQESLYDQLADAAGLDPLEFRHLNALRPGEPTATGQVIEDSLGMESCLDALRPAWKELRASAEEFNQNSKGAQRRGVGIASMWYGCGNTSLSNPSTIEISLSKEGQLTLYNGAVDIGQGSTTVILQIAADALGLPVSDFSLVLGDTALTQDAGKTSASRQTYVSGRAAMLAGIHLRNQVLEMTGAGPDAGLILQGHSLRVLDGAQEKKLDLSSLPAQDPRGSVLLGRGSFDPPTSPLDKMGQGKPYATYAFGAQICDLEVDLELGSVHLRRFVAAHDVGRAINPTLVEGQIHGGIAQGIGLALMEEFISGRTENLHDYLMPTFGDVPEIDVILIEEADRLGPYGAKGVGEPALIATAPAILNAIRHATGITIDRVPALPHRLHQAIREKGYAQDVQ